MSLLIKHGRVITAVDDYRADIFIQDEVVTVIGQDLSIPADRVVDASGKLVIPGGIDPHTHLDMPFGGTYSVDDFATGTRAAAFGGTTTIVDFAIQTKGRSTLEGLAAWHAKAEGKAVVDYGFHMIVTDMEGERLGEMRQLVNEGVTSYKLFMAYPGVLYIDDGAIFRVMREAAEQGTVVCMHAENGIVIDEIVKRARAAGKTAPEWHGLTRPTRMEAEAVNRAFAIAEVAGAPMYIVHLSSAHGLEEVVRARQRGVRAFAETCPQYLFLDHSHYQQEGFEGAKYVMSPPLRDKSNQEPLWRGLALGDIIAVSTDHCPFRFADQKRLGVDDFAKIPNGAPGIENRMSLIYHGGVHQGRLGLNKFVDVTSTAAAKMFGLFPRKGTIAVGSDADIVIFDPDRTETISVGNPCTHHMRVDYTAYEGIEVTGFPTTVIARGKVVVDGGVEHGRPGAGRFLKRGLFGG